MEYLFQIFRKERYTVEKMLEAKYIEACIKNEIQILLSEKKIDNEMVNIVKKITSFDKNDKGIVALLKNLEYINEHNKKDEEFMKLVIETDKELESVIETFCINFESFLPPNENIKTYEIAIVECDQYLSKHEITVPYTKARAIELVLFSYGFGKKNIIFEKNIDYEKISICLSIESFKNIDSTSLNPSERYENIKNITHSSSVDPPCYNEKSIFEYWKR